MKNEILYANPFHDYFSNWVLAACRDWNYPELSDDYYLKVYERIPKGVCALIAKGVEERLIIQNGRTFSLRDLGAKKGPYNWFARNNLSKMPSPNWEYYVQVAEYVRLSILASRHNMHIAFEDDLMDLALYRDDQLLVCIEVKEKADQLRKLFKGMSTYQEKVDFVADDRGNDPLRKSKYLVKRKPEYMLGLAIGLRLEYRIEYPADHQYRLKPDMIPWV